MRKIDLSSFDIELITQALKCKQDELGKLQGDSRRGHPRCKTLIEQIHRYGEEGGTAELILRTDTETANQVNGK